MKTVINNRHSAKLYRFLCQLTLLKNTVLTVSHMAGGYVTKLVNSLGEPTAINGETIQTWTMAFGKHDRKEEFINSKELSHTSNPKYTEHRLRQEEKREER